MMRHELLLPFICFLLQIKNTNQDTIPVGAIFDRDSAEIHTAFRFKIQDVNNHGQLRAKMNFTVALIDVKDIYTLSERMCSLMSQGVFALFGVTKAGSINAAQSISQALHMPFITPSLNQGTVDDPYQYEIYMYPSYIEGIVDIIEYYDWGKVYYVYDSDDGLQRVMKLYEFFNTKEHNLIVDIRRVPDVYNAYEMLRKLDRSRMNMMHDNRMDGFPRDPTMETMRIVLDLSSMDAYKAMLRQIIDVGMNRENYHYLLGGVGMDELDLRIFTHGGVNITGFRLLDYSSPKLKTFLQTWSSLSNESWPRPVRGRIGHEAALMVDAVGAFSRAMSSLDHSVTQGVFRRGELYNNGTQGIPCKREGHERPPPWTLGLNILSALQKVEFDGITGKVAFDENGFRRDYRLDVMELSYGKLPRKIGTWDNSTGFVTDRRRVRPPKRGDDTVGNTTLRITTVNSPPFLMKRIKAVDGRPLAGNSDHGRFEGYCVDLIEKLAEKVFFDYVIEPVKDGKYGSNSNGTWDGMVGELTRGVADMAVAPLTITNMRERSIDFTKPFMKTGISIMIKKPVKQKAGVFSFMNPLDQKVWACIILGYFGVSLILFFVGRCSPYEWHQADEKDKDGERGSSELTNQFTLQNTLWFSLGALMQQGSDISPRSISGRIVGSCWWFFTLIIISSYTANLAAFLTIENMFTPIDSADDLARQSEIRYGIQSDGSSEAFFSKTKVSVYKKMWEYMSSAEPSVFTNNTASGVERVRNSKSKYAFLLESPWNEYYNQQQPCDTMKVGPDLDSKGYGVATPDGSPYKTVLNKEVLMLRESGELMRLKQKWWYDKGKCGSVDQKESKQGALTLSNVSGVFHILIGGLGLAMLMAFFEYLFEANLRPKKSKTTVRISSSTECKKKSRMSPITPPSYGERENGGYSFTPPSQLVTFEGFAEGNTQTQV